MLVVLQFVHQHHESFLQPEFDALATRFNLSLNHLDFSQKSPFHIVEFPSLDVARDFINQSVFINAGFELIADANSDEEVFDIVKNNLVLKDKLSLYESTYCFRALTFGSKKVASHNPERFVSYITSLGIDGKVDVANPQTVFYLLNNRTIDGELTHVYFTKLIAQSSTRNHAINTMSLKTRPCLGTTSMDSEFAYAMCNLAQLHKGDLVLEPFFGSGSLALTAIDLGAFVVGSEITSHVITGNLKKGGVHYMDNHKHYKIDPPMVIRANSCFLPLRLNQQFDCIITDPPYGVREAIAIDSGKDIYVMTMCIAKEALRIGGHLVMWKHEDEGEHITTPTCDDFELLASPVQHLCGIAMRRLLVFKRVKSSDCEVSLSVSDEVAQKILSKKAVKRKARILEKKEKIANADQ